MTESPAAVQPVPEAAETPVFPVINQAILVVVLAIVALLGITAIRTLALRVTQYQVSVYEGYVRDALAKQEYDRAVEISTGALRSSVNRSDHWGRAWLLRGVAQVKLEDTAAALADLESSGVFFQERYYYAVERDRPELAAAATELARLFLAQQKGPEALRAFSVAAAGSGQAVEYLTRLHESMNEADRALLWPDGTPYIVLRGFQGNPEGKLEVVVEQQGRAPVSSGVAPDGSAASIELSQGTSPGRSAYACKAWMPLSDKPFALRLVARAEGGPMPEALLGFWFDSARQSAHTTDAAWVAQPDGSQACTIPNTFIAKLTEQGKAQGFSAHDGILNRAGFEFLPESASKVSLERVELLLPES
jgi:hypothetical protein